MKAVLKFPACGGHVDELLHHILLGIARRNLKQRVALNANHITIWCDVHVAGLDVVLRTAAALAKVVKVPAAQAGDSRPLGAAVAHVHMSRLLAVGRRVAGLYAAVDAFGSDHRLKGGETHDAPDGVAAVHHAGRTEYHLCAVHRKGVEVDHILNVSGAKDGGVHAHPVHRIDESVRGKAANHGASAALLAFLNEDFARNAE